MTTKTTTHAKYANLQLAAEALFQFNPKISTNAGAGTTSAYSVVPLAYLTEGNNRSSKFSLEQATVFSSEWTVLEHKSNTATGFSGTLFKYVGQSSASKGLVQNELVLSFRSTEFADDAARDNMATNLLEIKEHGWAFGQIADMEQWYEELKSRPDMLQGKNYSVTGYSLGGHLATAFNILRTEESASSNVANPVTATYTFNGAGVGEYGATGSLRNVMGVFSTARQQGSENYFKTPLARQMYVNLRATLNKPATSEEMSQALVQLLAAKSGPTAGLQTVRELNFLTSAVTLAKRVLDEAKRVNDGIDSGSSAPGAQTVMPTSIDATKLDYQLAVLQAGFYTRSFRSGLLDSLDLAYAKDRAPLVLFGGAPIYDIYGAPLPSAVSNSQHHYGQPVPTYIEDQPLFRGSYLNGVVRETAASGSLVFGEAKLLAPGFSRNDFGDTHSLVLLVDSLSSHNALAQLDPEFSSEKWAKLMEDMSFYKGRPEFLQEGQGEAEGDALDNLVGALGRYLGVDAAPTWVNLKGNPKGGTWAETATKDGYTGRNDLHSNLALIAKDPDYKDLMGKVKVEGIVNLATRGKTDFGAVVALQTLSPFVLKAKNDEGQARLDELWGGYWNREYDGWKADKTARKAGQPAKSFSDEWLADRAALLQAVMKRGRDNEASTLVVDNAAPPGKVTFFHYEDPSNEDADTVLATRTKQVHGLLDQHIMFGSEQVDTLIGYDNAFGDHLYGGGGADTLDGKGGGDHLEGGKGADIYKFYGDFGADTLVDSDGSGEIIVGDVKLEGGKKLNATTWLSADRKFEYHFTGNTATGERGTLRIVRAGNFNGQNAITVRAWKDGELGISLDPGKLSPAELAAGQGRPAVIQHGDRKVEGGYVVGESNRPDVMNAALSQLADDSIGVLADGYYPDKIPNFTAYGGGGTDALFGHEGMDYLDGGIGNDFVAGGVGSDTLIGGLGDDIIVADMQAKVRPAPIAGYALPAGIAGEQVLLRGANWAVYRDGNGLLTWDDHGASDQSTANLPWLWWYANDGVAPWDAERPEYGNDIDAGAGKDIAIGGYGSDSIVMGDDNDIAFGGDGHDDILGGAGDDRLYGDRNTAAVIVEGSVQAVLSGNDYIDGGDGNDIVYGDLGSDTLLGGAGDDYLEGDYDLDAAQSSDNRLIDFYAEHWDGSSPGYFGDDWLDGGDGNDTLYGSEGQDTLYGGADHDSLYGGTGDDALYGGTGDDWLVGGQGNDYLHTGGGSDYLIDNQGSNTFVAASQVPADTPLQMSMLGAGLGAEADARLLRVEIEVPAPVYISGGTGDDLYIVEENAGEVIIVAPDAVGGTGGDDRLQVAGTQADWSVAMSGRDLVLGGAGTSVRIQGYQGDDDSSTPSLAAQSLAGGVEFADGSQLSAQELAAIAATGTDAGDWLYGTSGADTIDARAGNDVVYARAGDDQVTGGEGDDRLFGERGNDTLEGGAGTDVLEGGAGQDVLRGGEGDDAYRFLAGDFDPMDGAGTDLIEDSEGADRIIIEGLDSAASLRLVHGGAGEEGAVNLLWDGGGVQVHGGTDALERIQVEAGGETRSLSSFEVPAQEPDSNLDPLNGAFLSAHRTAARAQITLAAGQGLLDKLPQTATASPLWRHVASDAVQTDLDVSAISTTSVPQYQTTQLLKDKQGNVLQDRTVHFVVPTSLFPSKVLFEDENAGTVSKATITRAAIEAAMRERGNETVRSAIAKSWAVSGTDLHVVAERTDVVVESTRELVGYQQVTESKVLSTVAEGEFGPGNNTVSFAGGIVSGGPGDDVIRSVLARADGVLTNQPVHNPWEVLAAQFGVWNARNQSLLTGQQAATFLDGGDGNDALYGGALADVLYGGRGLNTLAGGAGSDRYLVLDEGDGTGYDHISDREVYGPGAANVAHDYYGGPANEWVPEGADIDTVEFGPRIEEAQLRYSISLAGSAAFSHAATGHAQESVHAHLVVQKQDGQRLAVIELPDEPVEGEGIEYLEFRDGGRVSVAELTAQIRAAAPVLVQPLPDAQTSLGEPFDYFIPLDAFSLASGEAVALSVTLADGSPLPQWLQVSPHSANGMDFLRVNGTPAALQTAPVTLKVTATGPNGAATSDEVVLTFGSADGEPGDPAEPGNHAPMAAEALEPVAAVERQPFSWQVPATTFADADAGDTLAWTFLPDDPALAAWLSFDPATRTFSGTPGEDLVDQSVTGTLTVTDEEGAAASTPVEIHVDVLEGLHVLGTPAVDHLQGTPGADRIDGLGSADVMAGGMGNDYYLVDHIGDQTVESANEGNYDFVLSTVSYTLGAHVEELVLAPSGGAIDGTGNALANSIAGNQSDNRLYGAAGGDVLLGAEGNDRLEGGEGDDQLWGDLGNDTYVWTAGDGQDTIQESQEEDGSEGKDRLLLRGVEPSAIAVARIGDDLLLTHSQPGSGGVTIAGWFLPQDATRIEQIAFDNGVSWSLADVAALLILAHAASPMTGTSGNDTLVGDAHANVLSGGDGHDTLVAGAGNDSLLGGAGNDALNGGTGADTLIGGLGDDAYWVDDANDVITEAAGEGVDAVRTSIDYTLPTNVETLTLTGTTLNGTGNASANTLIGNPAANRLSGGAGDDLLLGDAGNDTLLGGEGNDSLNGGVGADTMTGGLGNDAYWIDDAGDVITELAGEGVDAVRTSIDATLAANLESLTLTGTTALNATGNAGANTLVGNPGANILAGGEGADLLLGGAGNDTYLLNRGWGADTVVDTDSTAGNLDIAQFGPGITADQLWFRQTGNHLEVSVIGTADKLTVNNWFAGNQHHVEQFKAGDGRMLLDTQVHLLIQAMASFSPPPMGTSHLTGSYQTTLAPLIAANWQ